MKGLIAGLVVVLAGSLVPMAWAYDWYSYGGHEYALTQDYGSWEQCENEAVTVGGHLATINDAPENAFLTDFIKDTYIPTYPWYHPSANCAWIGLELTGPNKEEPSSWSWVSGQPVTYFNLYSPPPEGYYGTYMYLLGANHESHVGTWCNSPEQETTYQPFGIIEVPEPSTLILLGAGALSLLGYAWRRRKRAT
jgi:hypothetical protein